MSVDIRLQYLWEPRLGEAGPPLQQVPPSIASQGHPQGGGDPSYQAAAPSVEIGHPVGSVAPTKHTEARAQRTEYRDEHRLWVEILTLIIGVGGFVALVWTFEETRNATRAATSAAETASQQLDLTTRPWVSVDIMTTQPLMFDKNGAGIWVQFILKNLGHSPARALQLHFEALPVQDRQDGYRKQIEICTSAQELPDSVSIRSVIMPGEQVTQMEFLRMSNAAVQKGIRKTTEPRPIVLLAIVGCVDYRFTFAKELHQTGFFFDIVQLEPANPMVWYSIGWQKEPFQVEEVGFRGEVQGSYAY